MSDETKPPPVGSVHSEPVAPGLYSGSNGLMLRVQRSGDRLLCWWSTDGTQWGGELADPWGWHDEGDQSRCAIKYLGPLDTEQPDEPPVRQWVRDGDGWRFDCGNTTQIRAWTTAGQPYWDAFDRHNYTASFKAPTIDAAQRAAEDHAWNHLGLDYGPPTEANVGERWECWTPGFAVSSAGTLNHDTDGPFLEHDDFSRTRCGLPGVRWRPAPEQEQPEAVEQADKCCACGTTTDLRGQRTTRGVLAWCSRCRADVLEAWAPTGAPRRMTLVEVVKYTHLRLLDAEGEHGSDPATLDLLSALSRWETKAGDASSLAAVAAFVVEVPRG